jgi:hypothetical protein
VVNVRSAVERTTLTVAEWANALLLLDQYSAVLFHGQATEHMKSETFGRQNSIVKFVGLHHWSLALAKV